MMISNDDGAGGPSEGNGKDSDGTNGGRGREKDDENIIRMPTLAERDRQRREAEKQERRRRRGPPMFNIPPATKVILAVLIGVHLVLSALSVFAGPGYYLVTIHTLGFVPARFSGEMPFLWLNILSPLGYMVLHGNWLHLGMNAVMLAAFGAGFERWQGPRAFLLFFLLCGLGGIFVHYLLFPFSQSPVIGASGGVSGLFAAALIMLHRMSGVIGLPQQSIWPIVFLWIGISLVLGMAGGPGGSSVAWAAHIGGFITGLAVLKFVFRIW